MGSLRHYRRKRDFKGTPEPAGRRARTRAAARPRSGRSFVIQKHAARRLHYDFRLEHGGVLLSWAIPKGPSLDPSERRLAVRTEDHPLEYGKFEGVIPKDHYGAGKVEIWDRGTWTPEGDPAVGLRSGHLTFRLDGSRLHGRFHLERIRNGRDEESAKENWLLIKSRHDDANGSTPSSEVRTATPPRERGVHWTKPSPVCEVAFTEWTRDGKLRHPSFQGLREDKSWRAVVRETPREMSGATNKEPAMQTENTRSRTRAKRAATPRFHESNGSIAALTHSDKILYPATGTTKRDVAEYLRAVAPRMLPYVAHRPLALVRCPNGVGTKCFFQKHLDGEEFITVHDAAGLVGLAQLGVLEIHVWGSKLETIERPDVMVLDLDPAPDVSWAAVVAAALELRDVLEKKHDVRSFAKLTGGKGVHVVVPNDPDHDWETHKRVAKAIAVEFAKANPDRLTTNPRKNVRAGRIFIDYLRNGRGATAIAPFSPRARENASVAVPIAWKELTARLKPDGITFEDAMRRARARDPWPGYPV